jgi:hypothetical protein
LKHPSTTNSGLTTFQVPGRDLPAAFLGDN